MTTLLIFFQLILAIAPQTKTAETAEKHDGRNLVFQYQLGWFPEPVLKIQNHEEGEKRGLRKRNISIESKRTPGR